MPLFDEPVIGSWSEFQKNAFLKTIEDEAPPDTMTPLILAPQDEVSEESVDPEVLVDILQPRIVDYPISLSAGELRRMESDVVYLERNKYQEVFGSSEPRMVMLDQDRFEQIGRIDQRHYGAVESIKRTAFNLSSFWRREPRAWEHSEHSHGFFEAGSGDLLPISPADAVEPDGTLKRVDIRLDRLRVFDYPGKGRHSVLLRFAAANNLHGNGTENVTFTQVYLVQEGQAAGVAGYPVFLGLNVGHHGAGFEVQTVNVKNEDDEKAMGLLDSPEIKAGLTLLSTAQPALAPLAGTAIGLGKLFLQRNKNIAVQHFQLGLDFEAKAAAGARLREGQYVAVQAPHLDWKHWKFNRQTHKIVNESGDLDLNFNYIIFRVSRSPATD